MARANNTPQRSLDEIPAHKVQVIVGDLLALHELGKPETDGEVENRISDYFNLCRQTTIRPGVESLSAALHIDRTTLWRWEQGEGCSRRRMEAVRAAKSMINSFVEQAMMSGQINPIPALFLAKNWMGYKDSYLFESQERQNANPYASMTPEQIAEQLRKDIPIDDEIDEAVLLPQPED
jgi:hypothetical protein